MQQSPWRHFAVLSAFMVVYVVGQNAAMWHERSHLPWSTCLAEALLSTPELVGSYLSLAAGIAIGTPRPRRRIARRGIGLLVFCVVTIIAIDQWLSPAATLAGQRFARNRGDGWVSPSDSTIYSPIDTAGHLSTAYRLLRERPSALSQPLGDHWREDNPRMLATHVATWLPRLVVPFVTIGLVLGAVTWLSRHATFSSQRDETIARWCTAWLLASGAWMLIEVWTSIDYAVLHHLRPYWWPLFLCVPFTIAAALGWRTALQEATSDFTPLRD